MSNVTALTAPNQAGFSLAPKSLDEAMRFADILSKSSIVPKDFKDNPGNCLVAIQWGAELGLQPMQAMQNIAVINGRPAVWGDAVLALVSASPSFQDIEETLVNGVATCTVIRKGRTPVTRTFSEADAKAAGLLGKPGPWTQYKNRMLQMRARAFAVRDCFADVLKGMPIAEEIQDYEKDITPRRPQRPAEIAAAAIPAAAEADSAERDALIELLQRAPTVAELEVSWKKVFSADERAIVGMETLKEIKAEIAAKEAEGQANE